MAKARSFSYQKFTFIAYHHHHHRRPRRHPTWAHTNTQIATSEAAKCDRYKTLASRDGKANIFFNAMKNWNGCPGLDHSIDQSKSVISYIESEMFFFFNFFVTQQLPNN